MNVAYLARLLAAERCSVHEIAVTLGRSEAFVAKCIGYTPKPDRHHPGRSSAMRSARARAMARAAVPDPSGDLLDLLNCSGLAPDSIGKVPTFSRLDSGTMGSWFLHPASTKRSASFP